MCDFSCRPETSLSRSSSLYGIRSLGDISPWYSHLVCLASDQGVRFQTLAEDIVLWSWARPWPAKHAWLFCVFQANRGESEPSAKRELTARGGALLSSHAARVRLAFASFRLKYAKITSVLQASKVVTLAVPLSTQMCEWVPANLMLGVALWWTSVSTRASGNRKVGWFWVSLKMFNSTHVSSIIIMCRNRSYFS